MSENGISELHATITEAQGLAGVAASLDAEVLVAQERLIDLRAAAKTSAIEDQQDLLEEHAVASAMQGLSLAPEPDRKPSAEEKDERDSKPSAEEEDKKKGAAAADASDECVICMDQWKSHIIIPCGHQCVCETCADRITAEGETCPICRAAVTMIVAVYL